MIMSQVIEKVTLLKSINFDEDNYPYSKKRGRFDYKMKPTRFNILHSPPRLPIYASRNDSYRSSLLSLPEVFIDRFIEIIPSLSLLMLSYTCKNLYVKSIDIRGLEAEYIDYEVSLTLGQSINVDY